MTAPSAPTPPDGGRVVEVLNLFQLDARYATYKKVDLAAAEQLWVQLDVDRFRALGRPGSITVTLEPSR